jgi:hypothetical protein
VVFYCVACVDKYRLKEVSDFVGLDCSTISLIANRSTEGEKAPRMLSIHYYVHAE